MVRCLKIWVPKFKTAIRNEVGQKLCIIIAVTGLCLETSGLHAQFFSTAYLTRSSPLSPTSYDRCETLNEEFAEDVRMLTEQHTQCLSGAPREESSEGGTCSKGSCQPLHTAMNYARKRQSEEVRTCNARVSSYLEHKRREQEAARSAAAEAERDRQKREAERRARDKSDQQKAEKFERDQRKEREAAEQAASQERDRLMEQERQQHEYRAQREREESRRREDEAGERLAEELRNEGYITAVRQTADQLKQEWHDRVRTGLPDVAADISAFMGASRFMVKGDDDLTVAEFISAADKLVDRAESIHEWISSPVQTFTDQVQSDAIRIVLAEPQNQATDARLTTIFQSVTEMNDVAHQQNPVAKSISSKALSQIELKFNTALGELKTLEADLGSFGAGGRTSTHEPLFNPFRAKPRRPSAEDERYVTNPFTTAEASGGQESASQGGPQVPSLNQTRSHNSSAFNAQHLSPTNTPSNVSSENLNPFLDDAQASPVPLQPAMKTSLDRVVQYRDPITKIVSKKRIGELALRTGGDDLDDSHCSSDGLGIITEKCEKFRHGLKKQSAPTMR